MHRMIDRPDIYSDQERYDYVRHITHLMQKTGGIKTKCYGEENLPAEGGYVLYPNHQGKYDAYGIVSAHKRDLSIVMDREMSHFALVDKIINILRGKRNTLRDFKPGCFKAATKSKVPIVPVVLVDSYKAYNSRCLLPVTTQVHFLPPIPYEEYRELNTVQISAIVRERIQTKLKDLGCASLTAIEIPGGVTDRVAPPGVC